MPLTKKGKSILRDMVSHYGSMEKGKGVFYASIKAGKLKGVHRGK